MIRGLKLNASEYWDQAMTYEEYLAQMTQRRDEYESNYSSTRIDAQVRDQFAGRSLRFLVITEDWCGDSSQFVPPVARLCDEIDGLEIRFLLRPDVLELADRYRDRSGRQPIPVIITLDLEGQEYGALLERPAEVTELMAAETRRFASENSDLDGINRAYANMPEETKQAVSANVREWRASHQDQFVQILFDDLASIVQQPASA